MSYIQTRARSAASSSVNDENQVKKLTAKATTAGTAKLATKRVALGDVSNKPAAANAKAKTAKPAAKAAPVVKKRTAKEPERQPLAPKRTLDAEPAVQVKAPKLEPVAAVEKAQYWTDLDAEDAGDPLMVSEYVVDIFEYMRELELATMPNASYMDEQTEITWKMRTILVDWLVDVHNKFRLLPETLFLAINIIDRFLSRRVVSVTKLQLVGITALFIASKYEEVVHPSVKNFIYMADNGYNEEEVLKSERYILQVLDFGLHYPNPMNFLRRISKADDYNIHSRTIAKYLIELTLLDHGFLATPPSLVAAAAAYLSRQMIKTTAWSDTLKFYSGEYEEEQVVEVADKITALLKMPVKHEAIYKKYASKKFMKVSIFVEDYIKLVDDEE